MLRVPLVHALSVLALILLCAKPASTQQPLEVSMVELIANSSSFDGKLIRVSGFLRLEFEGDELYLHREDYKEGMRKNGIWVDLTRAERNKYASKNMSYVFVEGIFDSRHYGHLGSTSGAITKILRIELL